MMEFVYIGLPTRVVFGAGSVSRLAVEIERLDAKRVLMIGTPGRTEQLKHIGAPFRGKIAGVFDKAVMHMPIEIVDQARELAATCGADCCVSVGGGSAIGFGKAVALTSSLPIIAVPTTYSGSEMTTIWGTTEGETKQTGHDPRVLPKAVIYDPDLTLELPLATSAASGMNALAHCVEALYAVDGNPIVSLMAEEGIRALTRSLPRIMTQPRDLDARGEALYGAWLAGSTISTTSVALHHKLCHVLGGLGLPHAETHAIMLAHAVKYNEKDAPEAMARITRAMDTADAAGGIYDLAKKLGLPLRLADIGMKEEDLERAAQIASAAPYPNPRKVTYAPVLAMLRNAYAGRDPH